MKPTTTKRTVKTVATVAALIAALVLPTGCAAPAPPTCSVDVFGNCILG